MQRDSFSQALLNIRQQRTANARKDTESNRCQPDMPDQETYLNYRTDSTL
jgi:hypothetical protein